MKVADLSSYLLHPLPDQDNLTRTLSGCDHQGRHVSVEVVTERGMTLYLNKQEIVTLMTLGDHPRYLAVGFLLNQKMLMADDLIIDVDVDDDLGVMIVRTKRQTNYEDKLQRKIRTSGCAQGTLFGDLMEKFADIKLVTNVHIRTSWLYKLLQHINTTPSIYQKAGAIHGCVLCQQGRPLLYMEDVGRHNAIDKIAGYMHLHNMTSENKIFYTTGRLTSEMVIKTVQMGIPILVSRSGFTAWGVELARQVGLTLIGRARGRQFTVMSGAQRLVYDADSGSGKHVSHQVRE